MAKLIYASIVSVDGYIADKDGNFDWAEPDAEVHASVNDLERSIGTYLYGRRLYEVMDVWQTCGTDSSEPDVVRDFGEVWRAAEKVVYSRTLDSVSTPRTRLERQFDPSAIRQLKADSATDISIGGPNLAAHAIGAGLVDEYHLFVVPAIVGGGNPALPDGVRLDLELVDERRFAGGTVHLHYRAVS